MHTDETAARCALGSGIADAGGARRASGSAGAPTGQPRKTAAKPLTGKHRPEPEDARRNEDAMGR